MTGLGGLERQLGSAEIVAQVALARTPAAGDEGRVHGHGRAGAQPRQRARGDRPARHRRRHRPQEPGRSRRSATGASSSACRTAASSRRWRCRCTPPTPALRARLLPRAPRIAPDELVALGDALRARDRLSDAVAVDAARRHQRRRRRDRRPRAPARRQVRGAEHDPVQHRRRPGARAAGCRARRAAMARELHQRGVLTKLRQSAGQDVEAGCGQLRARHERDGARRIEIVAA